MLYSTLIFKAFYNLFSIYKCINQAKKFTILIATETQEVNPNNHKNEPIEEEVQEQKVPYFHNIERKSSDELLSSASDEEDEEDLFSTNLLFQFK